MDLDDGVVTTDDTSRWEDSPSEGDTTKDNHEESDVGRGRCFRDGTLGDVDAESDQTTHQRSGVEDDPEDTERSAFVLLDGIRHPGVSDEESNTHIMAP